MLEGCSPEPAGGLLEVPGDGVPRWMAVYSNLRKRLRGTGSGLQADSFAHTFLAQFSCDGAAWGTLEVMTEDDNSWYYDIAAKQVVQGKQTNALDRMGPYPDKATAEQALKIAAARNKAADAEDDWNA